jgi:serine/threonine-protein kinase
VLAFQNIGGDTASEYFSRGMTEELLNALTKAEGLRVRSAISLRGEPDAREVGQRLGAEAVLGGSVRRAANRLRISARLSSVATGDQLWAETYEREMKDVFAVQEEIARDIAGALRLRLSGGGDSLLVARSTENLAAYDLYLKGRYAWTQRTRGTLAQAARYFERAVALDPRFAAAYVGLAETYVLFPHYGVARASVSWPKTKAAAERALALDSTLAEARAALAYGMTLHDWDWAAAEREFRRAIAEKPDYATGRHWYGEFLDGRGRLDEAIDQKRRALALDPLSRIIGMSLARSLYFSHRSDEATAQLMQTLQLDPNFAIARRVLGLTYLRQKRYDAAIAEIQKAVDLGQRRSLDVAVLAHAYGVIGDRTAATRLLAELESRGRSEYVQDAAFAIAYTGLGDRDRAFAWLDRALESRDPWLEENILDPLLEPLYADPRFAGIRTRMGLEP